MKKLKKAIIVFAIIFFVLLLISDDENKTNTTEVNNETVDSYEEIAVDDSSVQSKRSRILSIGVSEGAVGFDASFALAKGVGIQVVELPTYWDESQSSENQFTSVWLPIANAYYPAQGVSIGLGLNPIDTNNDRMPGFLKGKNLNDPEVIKNFKKYVDYAKGELSNSDVEFVNIGNEIDSSLGTSKAKWEEYTEFFKAVAPYVRQSFPGAEIGSKITYEGLTEHEDLAASIVSASDVVMVTYYPLNGSFQVNDPASIEDDFAEITTLYPDKKIYFTEIGYPSGATNGSSQAKQAEFIHELFSAWDKYNTQITMVNILWLHDPSPAEVKDFQNYYGSSNKAFGSFLGTLGLRTYEGKDKPAFLQLQEEAESRGW